MGGRSWSQCSQLAAVCSAYQHSAQLAQVDTVTGVQGEWHQQAGVLCDGVAEPEAIEP